MTVNDLKSLVMRQVNDDPEDAGDYSPQLLGYLNAGYELLSFAFAASRRVGGKSDALPVPPLAADTNVPRLPERHHRAIADYATWLVYRNGNIHKQQRGERFLRAFEEALLRIRNEGGAWGESHDIHAFHHLPE